MKKVVLSLAGVMAAAAFAPEASALPLFARQTGMACNACHFQHFPMLNAFGRSFKASGFTLTGAQGKVEGDDLSIPDTLNMAVLTTAGYVKTNAAGATPVQANVGVRTTGNGSIYVPGTNGEFSLFIGGRVSDFAGALAEVGLLGNVGTSFAQTVGLTSAKIPMLWEVADGTRAGVVLFTTNGQGASYGFEELNTGANAIHIMTFAGGDFNGSIGSTVSAQQYIGTGAAATGAAIVANNSMGFVNLTKFHMAGPQDLGGTGLKLGSTYFRLAGTFDVAGFDTGVGIQSWSGSSADMSPLGVATLHDTKATAIDGQMQGELGGMPVGFYASYARAPQVVAGGTAGNVFNNPGTATGARTAFVVSAELGVIPEKATVGLAIRRGKSGSNGGTLVAGANDTDNSWMLAGTYKLAQNMMAQLTYTSQSGGFWTAANQNLLGSKQTTLNLTTLF